MKRANLVSTLDLVSRALATDPTIPVFQCFMFHVDSVVAYNDALGIMGPCDEMEPFGVNGQMFLGLLKNSQGEDVTFELDNQDVTIKCAKSIFKLPFVPEEDFLFEEPKDEWAVQLPITPDLLFGFEACMQTSSRDEATQGALVGACLHQGSKMILYSCDGDALTRYITKVKAVKAPDYMMPNAFCEAVLKVAADTNAEKGTLSLSEGWAKAEFDTGFTVYGRLIINQKGVDHGALIDKTIKGKPLFVAIPDGLEKALSRARVVADPESAKTILTVEGGKLKIHTETLIGVVRDSLPMPKHEDVEAKVSAELMQRTIGLNHEVAILENCVAYRNGETLLQVISNMG